RAEAPAIPACDQYHGCAWKRAQRDAARVGVGCLRVVVPADARPLTHELQPMLDTLETADRLVDGVIAESRDVSHRGRGEGIFHVVPARQWHRREWVGLGGTNDVAGRGRGQSGYRRLAAAS